MSNECELFKGENSVIEINGIIPHFAYHRYFPYTNCGDNLRIYKYVLSTKYINCPGKNINISLKRLCNIILYMYAV
jgi:hypothetical protein